MSSCSRIVRPTASLLSTAAATSLRTQSSCTTCGRTATRAASSATAMRPRKPSSRTMATSARSSQQHQQLRRPTLRPASPAANAVSFPRGSRSIFIQTESTPNPDALKFLPNHRVLPADFPSPFVEYMNPRSTISPPYPSPLAAQLMNIDGVTSVFYGADFITVTKSPEANWAHVKAEIFALITEAITAGQEIVTIKGADDGQGGTAPVEVDSLAYDENDSEVVGMIKELLETRIRPAIQEDGGDIDFRGFEDGQVLLKLRGACRTCDSSTVTLKNGIEGMLMHYIEEVKGVHQVMDQEEEVAMAEFAKFEEKLRQQKGPDAAPTTPGKGSLDSVAG